jgi:hypothetical protein
MAAPVSPPLRVIPLPRTAASDPLRHWLFLLLAGGVIVAAMMLRIGSDGQVYFPLVDLPLPGTCTYRTWLGIDCPGCGLTRCFICMVRGDVRRAAAFNPAGILLFALVAAQVPFRLVQLWRVRRGQAELRSNVAAHWLLGILVVAMLLQWLWRLLG